MHLEITRTTDGSDTLFNPDLNQHYHSTYGAVQESKHIFIENGFLPAIEKSYSGVCLETKSLNILEIGFGTGLNALLTQNESEKARVPVVYNSLEAFPITFETWSKLNYPEFLGSVDHATVFGKIHQAHWNQPVQISTYFRLVKIHDTLESVLHLKSKSFISPVHPFHLVYFDAFSPDVQPELWTAKVFNQIYKSMANNGILVTYSVKGTVVRSLKSVGFFVEKLPGPPGKRHILRAIKKTQG
jgi:tRNA U34 5-methylaminomethyl-2-thiouridine-forming methyltransferase MnmC